MEAQRTNQHDNHMSPATLKHCAVQLAPVLKDIFKLSIQTHTVPVCFKKSVVIPVPKKAKVCTLNDYQPIALTSVVMKVFLKPLKSSTVNVLDPLQFTYRKNRSVDDVVGLVLHWVLQHLEYPDTYTRILFVDYSSALNTVIPEKLFHKLRSLAIDASLCYWILNFLLCRPQVVRIGDLISDTIVLSRGSPQGCCLSPLLYFTLSIQLIAHHITLPPR